MTPAQRRNGHHRWFIGPRPALIATSAHPSEGVEPVITDIFAADFPNRYV